MAFKMSGWSAFTLKNKDRKKRREEKRDKRKEEKLKKKIGVVGDDYAGSLPTQKDEKPKNR